MRHRLATVIYRHTGTTAIDLIRTFVHDGVFRHCAKTRVPITEREDPDLQITAAKEGNNTDKMNESRTRSTINIGCEVRQRSQRIQFKPHAAASWGPRFSREL